MILRQNNLLFRFPYPDDLPEKIEASPVKRSRAKSIDFDDEEDGTDILGSLGLDKKSTGISLVTIII